MANLLLIGAGGQAKVTIDAAMAVGNFSTIACLDDYHPIGHTVLSEAQVVGRIETVEQYLNDYDIVIALGDNQKRLAIATQLNNLNVKFASIIHPSAVVSSTASIGQGCVIFPNAVVHTDAVIGAHCIINSGAIVEHDCRLGKGVHIAPNASLAGRVQIGNQTMIGMGALVKQDLNIGSKVTVGAGAVVLKSVPDDTTIYGNPAA